MKYDFTKCNNLNFKIKDGTTGYIKVVKNPFRFYLYFDTEGAPDLGGMFPESDPQPFHDYLHADSSICIFYHIGHSGQAAQTFLLS